MVNLYCENNYMSPVEKEFWDIVLSFKKNATEDIISFYMSYNIDGVIRWSVSEMVQINNILQSLKEYQTFFIL